MPEDINLFAAAEQVSTVPAMLQATLTPADVNGCGVLQAPSNDGYVISGGRTIVLSKVDLRGGIGSATWELQGGSLLERQEVSLGLVLAYQGEPSRNTPLIGGTLVLGALARLSTIQTTSATAPLPRFANASLPAPLFAIIR
jgi:hypothetical protein